jgi:hypothetical protein
MRHAAAVVLAVVVFASSNAAPPEAANLDAPAVKIPTIGSELTRGYNVTLGCDAQYWDSFYQCINGQLALENRRNTDTNAFLLGVYAGSMIRLSKYEARYGAFSWNNGCLGLLVGREWYDDTILLQAKLDVSDRQLSAVLEVTPAVLGRVEARWKAQTTEPPPGSGC